MNYAGRTAGFTLIETLVAFVILSLALSVFLGVFTDVLDHSGNAAAEAHAEEIAENILAGLGKNVPLIEGHSAGDEDQYHWDLIIFPYGTSDDQLNRPIDAHDVVLTIVWHSGGRAKSITAETLKLGSG